MKIIDAFIFYNEIKLLDYRLNILSNIVDYFIIVESSYTFSGKKKELYFDKIKYRYKKFLDKIVHIVVEDFPYIYPNIDFCKRHQWENEIKQRNSIDIGIKELKTKLLDIDLIMISDIDEIPDLNLLNRIKNNNYNIQVLSLQLDTYYYNLNTKCDAYCTASKIIKYKKYKELNKTIQEIRVLQIPSITNAGWHLSFFGNEDFIVNKLENFSHQEYNKEYYKDINNIKGKIKKCKDLFDRPNSQFKFISLKENKYLPPLYQKYLI